MKLPIVQTPKSFGELNENDYLTMSLFVNDAGPSSGLYLRQIDTRQWHFNPVYAPLKITTTSSSPPLQQVIINEIAWAGTNASAYDEWLELYNTTTSTIDLAGWKLANASGTLDISLSGTMSPHAYYLLERTNDTTVSDIPADMIYTGSLHNDGEVLTLQDAEQHVQDKIDASLGWFAGNNETRATMERVNPNSFGSDSSNWQTNDGITRNGIDATSNSINGTPRAQNSWYSAQ